MRKWLIIPVVALLALIANPTYAAEPLQQKGGVEPKIGSKVVLDKNIEQIYMGRNDKGERVWQATFNSLPLYTDDLKTKINPTWHFDVDKWVAGANLFTAEVGQYSTKVTIEYQGKLLILDPNLKIGNKTIKPVSTVPQVVKDYYNPNYVNNTLQWDYGVCKRQIRLIEGSLLQYFIFDDNPHGDVNIASIQRKDYGIDLRPNEAWDAEGNSLEVVDNLVYASEFDREDILYPVVIDPSPEFTTSSSDGYLEGYNPYGASRQAAWDTCHDDTTAETTNKTGVYLISGDYQYYNTYYYTYIERAALYFDTSSLPDGVSISSGTLDLYVTAKQERVDNPEFQLQGGMPTYPSDPLVDSDYLYSYYSGDYGSIFYDDITTDQYNTITLTADGRDAISDTGTTKFIIRDSSDINDVAPIASGTNRMGCYSYEQGAGYQPTLTVTYSAEAPSINSVAASEIDTTSARLNSTLVDDGGDTCEIRFGYGETTQTAENFTSYDTVTDWVDGYTTGNNPYYDASSLTANTTHYFRVQAKNTYGTTTSSTEQTFDTLNDVGDPSGLRGIPSDDSISLTWTKGTGAGTSVLRYDIGDYPADETSGYLVYSGTANNYTHTGLDAGTTYYYSVWGLSGATYSDNSSDATVTTSAVGTSGDDLTNPVTPPGMFQEPDATAWSNLTIVYTAINGVADSLSMPRGTAYMIILMVMAGGIAFILYRKTENPAMALFGAAGVTVFGWFMGIVPFWVFIILIGMGIGLMITRRTAIQ